MSSKNSCYLTYPNLPLVAPLFPLPQVTCWRFSPDLQGCWFNAEGNLPKLPYLILLLSVTFCKLCLLFFITYGHFSPITFKLWLIWEVTQQSLSFHDDGPFFNLKSLTIQSWCKNVLNFIINVTGIVTSD